MRSLNGLEKITQKGSKTKLTLKQIRCEKAWNII